MLYQCIGIPTLESAVLERDSGIESSDVMETGHAIVTIYVLCSVLTRSGAWSINLAEIDASLCQS